MKRHRVGGTRKRAHLVYAGSKVLTAPSLLRARALAMRLWDRDGGGRITIYEEKPYRKVGFVDEYGEIVRT